MPLAHDLLCDNSSRQLGPRQLHPGHLWPLVRSHRGFTRPKHRHLCVLPTDSVQSGASRKPPRVHFCHKVKVCYTLQLGGTVPVGGSNAGLLFSMSNLAAPMWSSLGPTRHSHSRVAGFFIGLRLFFIFAVVNVVEPRLLVFVFNVGFINRLAAWRTSFSARFVFLSLPLRSVILAVP